MCGLLNPREAVAAGSEGALLPAFVAPIELHSLAQGYFLAQSHP